MNYLDMFTFRERNFISILKFRNNKVSFRQKYYFIKFRQKIQFLNIEI